MAAGREAGASLAEDGGEGGRGAVVDLASGAQLAQIGGCKLISKVSVAILFLCAD